jgi:hypothetical protein
VHVWDRRGVIALTAEKKRGNILAVSVIKSCLFAPCRAEAEALAENGVPNGVKTKHVSIVTKLASAQLASHREHLPHWS